GRNAAQGWGINVSVAIQNRPSRGCQRGGSLASSALPRQSLGNEGHMVKETLSTSLSSVRFVGRLGLEGRRDSARIRRRTLKHVAPRGSLPTIKTRNRGAQTKPPW